MAEHPSRELVVLGRPNDDRPGGMPVLMRGHPDPDPVQNCGRNLVTKGAERLVPSILAREEPGLVRAAQERRAVLVHILLDELGQALLEIELEPDSVLHVIVREYEPIGRERPR